jgi:hypothetical protein
MFKRTPGTPLSHAERIQRAAAAKARWEAQSKIVYRGTAAADPKPRPRDFGAVFVSPYERVARGYAWVPSGEVPGAKPIDPNRRGVMNRYRLADDAKVAPVGSREWNVIVAKDHRDHMRARGLKPHPAHVRPNSNPRFARVQDNTIWRLGPGAVKLAARLGIHALEGQDPMWNDGKRRRPVDLIVTDPSKLTYEGSEPARLLPGMKGTMEKRKPLTPAEVRERSIAGKASAEARAGHKQTTAARHWGWGHTAAVGAGVLALGAGGYLLSRGKIHAAFNRAATPATQYARTAPQAIVGAARRATPPASEVPGITQLGMSRDQLLQAHRHAKNQGEVLFYRGAPADRVMTPSELMGGLYGSRTRRVASGYAKADIFGTGKPIANGSLRVFAAPRATLLDIDNPEHLKQIASLVRRNGQKLQDAPSTMKTAGARIEAAKQMAEKGYSFRESYAHQLRDYRRAMYGGEYSTGEDKLSEELKSELYSPSPRFRAWMRAKGYTGFIDRGRGLSGAHKGKPRGRVPQVYVLDDMPVRHVGPVDLKKRLMAMLAKRKDNPMFKRKPLTPAEARERSIAGKASAEARKRLFQIQGPKFTAGLEVTGEHVTNAAPILRSWTMGRHHEDVRAIAKKRGLTMTEIHDTPPSPPTPSDPGHKASVASHSSQASQEARHRAETTPSVKQGSSGPPSRQAVGLFRQGQARPDTRASRSVWDTRGIEAPIGSVNGTFTFHLPKAYRDTPDQPLRNSVSRRSMARTLARAKDGPHQDVVITNPEQAVIAQRHPKMRALVSRVAAVVRDHQVGAIDQGHERGLIPDGTRPGTVVRAYKHAALRAMHKAGLGDYDTNMDDAAKAEFGPLKPFMLYVSRRIFDHLNQGELKGAWHPFREEFGQLYRQKKHGKLTGHERMRMRPAHEFIKIELGNLDGDILAKFDLRKDENRDHRGRWIAGGAVGVAAVGLGLGRAAVVAERKVLRPLRYAGQLRQRVQQTADLRSDRPTKRPVRVYRGTPEIDPAPTLRDYQAVYVAQNPNIADNYRRPFIGLITGKEALNRYTLAPGVRLADTAGAQPNRAIRSAAGIQKLGNFRANHLKEMQRLRSDQVDVPGGRDPGKINYEWAKELADGARDKYQIARKRPINGDDLSLLHTDPSPMAVKRLKRAGYHGTIGAKGNIALFDSSPLKHVNSVTGDGWRFGRAMRGMERESGREFIPDPVPGFRSAALRASAGKLARSPTLRFVLRHLRKNWNEPQMDQASQSNAEEDQHSPVGGQRWTHHSLTHGFSSGSLNPQNQNDGQGDQSLGLFDLANTAIARGAKGQSIPLPPRGVPTISGAASMTAQAQAVENHFGIPRIGGSTIYDEITGLYRVLPVGELQKLYELGNNFSTDPKRQLMRAMHPRMRRHTLRLRLNTQRHLRHVLNGGVTRQERWMLGAPGNVNKMEKNVLGNAFRATGNAFGKLPRKAKLGLAVGAGAGAVLAAPKVKDMVSSPVGRGIAGAALVGGATALATRGHAGSLVRGTSRKLYQAGVRDALREHSRVMAGGTPSPELQAAARKVFVAAKQRALHEAKTSRSAGLKRIRTPYEKVAAAAAGAGILASTSRGAYTAPPLYQLAGDSPSAD